MQCLAINLYAKDAEKHHIPEENQKTTESEPDDLANGVRDDSTSATETSEISNDDFYQDQYLVDDWPDDYPEFEQDDPYSDQEPGQRSFSTELTAVYRERSGSESEKETSAQLRWSRETLNYGYLSFYGGLSYLSDSQDVFFRTGNNPTGRAVFAQDELPLFSSWFADNTLGVHSASSNPVIQSGFRVHLPSSLIQGVSSSLTNKTHTLRLSAGEVGRFEGFSGLGFRTDDADLVTLGYDWKLAQQWDFSSQWLMYKVDSVAFIPEHRSLASSLRYRALDTSTEYRLNLLISDSGHGGSWFDGKLWQKSWEHKFGWLYLEDDVHWGDSLLNDNRAGAYWRANRISIIQTWGGGITYDETNIDEHPEQHGNKTIAGFLNLSRRITAGTRIGGSVTITSIREGNGRPGIMGETGRYNGFINQDNLFGPVNYQVTYLDSGLSGTEVDQVTLNWDQNWSDIRRFSISTSLGVEFLTEDEEARTLVGGVTLQHEFGNGVRMNLAVNHTRNEEEMLTATTDSISTSGNLSFNWRASRIWEWGLQLYVNEVERESDNAVLPTNQTQRRDSRLILTLRSNTASGRPYRTLGYDHELGGIGQINGYVFFDENGNKIRDPGENAASRLVVYLDGRFATETDSTGYFEFAPVFAGPHTLSLAVEDLPLPWIPESETPVEVLVTARDSVTSNFALTRLNQ